MILSRLIKTILARVRGEVTTSTLIKRGMKAGRNFHVMNGVWIDPGHCWLIEFGNNVTLAPKVTILAHDASPQAFRNVTKIGRVVVGSNVFLGACSVVLPGVTIGDNVVIGAGSVVTKNIPGNCVAAGNPAKPIMSLSDYLNRVDNIGNYFDSPNDYFPDITEERRSAQLSVLSRNRFALLGKKPQ